MLITDCEDEGWRMDGLWTIEDELMMMMMMMMRMRMRMRMTMTMTMAMMMTTTTTPKTTKQHTNDGQVTLVSRKTPVLT